MMSSIADPPYGWRETGPDARKDAIRHRAERRKGRVKIAGEVGVASSADGLKTCTATPERTKGYCSVVQDCPFPASRCGFCG